MNKVVSMEEIAPLIEEQLKKDGEVSFTPKGISMLPTIRGGVDTVVLEKPSFPLKKYAIVLYKRDDGDYIMHRVIKVKKDSYVMRGDNQYKKEYGIRDDQVIGVVKSFNRDGHEYEVSGFANWKYVKKINIKKRYISTRIVLGKVKRKLTGKKQ